MDAKAATFRDLKLSSCPVTGKHRFEAKNLPSSQSPTTRPEPNRDRYNPLSMTVFSANEVNDQQLDWTILRDGGVALYCKPEILTQDLNWLESKGYGIVSFEAGEWSCEEQMHLELKSALSFPDYYGRNLDALNECICEDLVVPDEGGLVLVFRSYDSFASAVQLDMRAGGRSFAEIVLHVL